MMKKNMFAVLVLLVVGFFAANAFAWGCGGHNGWNNNGMRNNGMHNNGMNNNGMYNSGSGVQNEAYQVFSNDTGDLRAAIQADRAELNRLMTAENPDSRKAGELLKKISRAEKQLRIKAQEYNLYGTGMMEYGRGWSCGIGGHQHRFAGCW